MLQSILFTSPSKLPPALGPSRQWRLSMHSGIMTWDRRLRLDRPFGNLNRGGVEGARCIHSFDVTGVGPQFEIILSVLDAEHSAYLVFAATNPASRDVSASRQQYIILHLNLQKRELASMQGDRGN
jgi:hypothetical protein